VIETALRDHRIGVADGLTLYCRDYVGDPSHLPVRLPVLCLPGLTRNGRDFHDLASHLSAVRRVLALDLRGRGRSDHDPDWRRYRLDVYVDDVIAVLDALAVSRVIIIGTSLGGLVGMFFGAQHPERLLGLVLNDIGPELDPQGMNRIASSVGRSGPVDNWEQAAAVVKEAHATIMPDFTAADWLLFARQVYREREAGLIVRDMDPQIGKALREASTPTPDLWQTFESLGSLPILTLRGELSDLLTQATVSHMQQRHPTMNAVLVPNRGHAPTLNEPASRTAIDHFLEQLP
jgi:pimeloyl-ACP methyl ester carboxylesterase